MNSDYPLVSIVIPIYNVELYLSECLTSVLNQTYQNWNAILINDGSTDASKSIAETFIEADHRFKLINQINGGLGSARNSGVKNAKGDYLFFLDSDDILIEDGIERMVNVAKSDDSIDLVIGGLSSFYTNNASLDEIENDQNFILLKNKIGSKFSFKESLFKLDQLNTYLNIAHGKLFKLDFWHKLECHVPLELRMAEDFIPVKKYMNQSNLIAIEDIAVIKYRQRDDSASKSKSLNCFEVFRAIPEFRKNLLEIDLNDSNRNNYWNKFIIRMYILHLEFCPDKNKVSFIKKLKHHINDTPVSGINLESFIYKSSFFPFFSVSLFSFRFINNVILPNYRKTKRNIYQFFIKR